MLVCRMPYRSGYLNNRLQFCSSGAWNFQIQMSMGLFLMGPLFLICHCLFFCIYPEREGSKECSAEEKEKELEGKMKKKEKRKIKHTLISFIRLQSSTFQPHLIVITSLRSYIFSHIGVSSYHGLFCWPWHLNCLLSITLIENWHAGHRQQKRWVDSDGDRVEHYGGVYLCQGRSFCCCCFGVFLG